MHRSVLFTPFEPWHLEAMTPREGQLPEYEVFKKTQGVYQYGEFLLTNSIYHGTVLVGGRVMASAGISELYPHIGYCWAVFSEDFLSCSLRERYKVAKEIEKQMKGTHYSRIQATCEEGFAEAEAFLRKIGMEEEGLLKKYGSEGKNHKLFSYTGE